MPKTGKNSKGSVFKKKSSGSGVNTDFAKKKAKVGKKVERSTVTKISVQSKQIHVPLQSQITGGSPQDERGVLDKMLKQLQHYSGSNRTQSLTDLNNFILGSVHAESYSSLIIPHAMELLFDDEADTREALLVLMSTITINIQSQSMKAVMSVLVTYMCSGLTSLNKGVRKDALLLLCQVAETQAELMPPFLDKILKNILGLLSRASLIFNSSQSGAASSTPSASSTSGNMSIGSKEKKDQAKGDKKSKAQGAASDSARSNLLLLLLHVIRLVLSSGVAEGDSDVNAQLISDSIEKIHQIRRHKAGLVATAGGGGGAVQVSFAPLRRVALFHGAVSAAEPSSYTPAQARDSARMSDAGQISADTETTLCDQLRTVWARLSLGESLLKAAEVRSLTEAASTVLLMLHARAGVMRNCVAFRSLLKTALSRFPYSAAEAQVASSTSELVQQSSRAVHALNMVLCEVALGSVQDIGAAPSSSDVELSACMSEVSSYLLSSLDDLTGRFRDRAKQLSSSPEGADDEDDGDGEAEGEGESDEADGEDDDDDDGGDKMDVDDEDSARAESRPEAATARKAMQKGQVYSIDALSRRRAGGDMGATKRLFDCLQIFILDPAVWLWSAPPEGSAGSDGDGAHSRDVLSRLALLNTALVEYPRGEAGRQHSQKDIKTVVSASIACLAQMCVRCDQPLSKTSLQVGNAASTAEEIGVASLDLAQTLLPMPTLLRLRGWGEEQKQKSTDLFLLALLSVLRRLPSSRYHVSVSDNPQARQPFFREASASAVGTDTSVLPSAGWSDAMQSQLHTLLGMVSSLFLPPSDMNESASTGSKGGANSKWPFYASCDPAQRQVLLDIYAQTPLQDSDLSAVSAALGELMAPSSVSLDERRVFLRAFLKRRMDMSPTEVVSVLFQMLSAQTVRLKELSGDEEAILSALLQASSGDSRRLSSEVSTTLLAMSTAAAPQKIVTFLKARLLKLGAAAGAAVMTGPYADAPSATRHHWPRAHLNHCALAEICRRLLPPCLSILDSGESGSDGSSGAKGKEETDRGRDALASVLACASAVAASKCSQSMPSFSEDVIGSLKAAAATAQPGTAPVIASHRETRVELLLVEPFARLLSTTVPGACAVSLLADHLRVHGISQTDIPGIAPSLIADHPFLETYLRGLLGSWEATSSAQVRLPLVHSLALYMRHDGCAEASLKCKGFLKAYVAFMAASAQGMETGKGEEENSARHALGLVLTDLARYLE